MVRKITLNAITLSITLGLPVLVMASSSSSSSSSSFPSSSSVEEEASDQLEQQTQNSMSGSISTWEWGALTGGHGYSYIREEFLPDTLEGDKTITIPRLFTQDEKFTGNYREKRVSNIEVDLNTFTEPGYPEALPITINIVGSYNGSNYNVFFSGEDMPREWESWKSYSFIIPSQSDSLPIEWGVFNVDDSSLNHLYFDKELTDNIFRAVIKNVNEISISYGPLDHFYYNFNSWDVGARNMKITTNNT